MVMDENYPDIEIYLAHADIERIDIWLNDAIQALPLTARGKSKWLTTGERNGNDIPVMLVTKAADGFASLWFDSPATPWSSDSDCARAAAQALGCEVRCSLGGWQPGDDPDRFLQVLPDGREGPINWPDSGT